MAFGRIPLAAGVAAALLTTSMSANAQNTGACDPFTMVSDGSARAVTFVDTAADGPGPGDQRIGRREVADMDGNPIGHVRWITTVLDQPGDDSTSGENYSHLIVVLEDGHIMYHTLDTTNRPAQDTSDIPWVMGPTGVISGGNGAYTGAHGTVAHRRDGLVLTYEVDVDCD